MNKYFLLITTFFSLLVFSCPEPGFKDIINNDNNNSGNSNSSSRRFWAWDLSGSTETAYQLTAILQASNERVEIWVESGANLGSSNADSVAAEYMYSIYPRMMDVFGWNDPQYGFVMDFIDIDENGKIILLLLNIRGEASGYFHPNNILSNNFNSSDMLYIDAGSWVGTQAFYETIAHEFQHLINFASTLAFRSTRNSNGRITALNQMDTWIDEGLSEGAQYIYTGTFLGDGINQQRLAWFIAAPLVYSNETILPEGNNFFVWGNYINDYPSAILDDYATVNMFFNWLRIQSSPQIFKDIITSVHSNHLAVTTASANRIGGSYSSWAVLLETWMAANYINASSGFYGYRNQLPLPSVVLNQSVNSHIESGYITKNHFVPKGYGASIGLFPGEGVYSYVTNTTGTVPSNSGVINYIGLTKTGTVGSSVPPGGARLTYNVNTNIEGGLNNGLITGQIPSSVIGGASASVINISPQFSMPSIEDLLKHIGAAFSYDNDSENFKVFSNAPTAQLPVSKLKLLNRSQIKKADALAAEGMSAHE